MGTRQEDLWAGFFTAHIMDIRADTITRTEHFPWDQFVTADHGFRAAEIDNHVAVFHALHGAADDFAYLVFEFAKLFITFSITHLLQHHLLSSLCRYAAEVDRWQQVADFIADGELCIDFLRVFQRQFGHLVFNVFYHGADAEEFNFTGFLVDLGADVMFMTVFTASCDLNRLLHRFKNGVFRQSFFARYSISNLQQFCTTIYRLACTHCNIPS